VAASEAGNGAHAQRAGDPGYHLIAEGRRALERTIGFRAPVRLRITRLNVRLGIGGYVGTILTLALTLLALALWALSTLAPRGPEASVLVLFALCGFLPVTEVETALINRAVTWIFGAITLPAVGQEGSLHQRVFSGPGGTDPYAAAVSDVYQDLFGEGSYTGKGIYDVDAARAGLASDVEVVEEVPIIAKLSRRSTFIPRAECPFRAERS
jgi:hypothetical protein